jgi:3-hydroxyacyl-CoA dehydrogenase / enoyl-CoA hydratase / 3-hydroxybutyryl-CoA epimerase
MAVETQDTTQQAEAAAGPGRLTVVEGVAWLVLDDPAKKVNTLSSRLFAWFEEQVGLLEREPASGLVILSGKADGFVAGADIEELRRLADPTAVVELLQRGHGLLGRLAALPFPVVAAIHGACLGGGLELALACDYRVATEHPKTKLGLPEVQLGLIPGLGGTQRLPRLLGVPDALDLILTGKQIDARRARRMGLVDDVCHPADLRQAAERALARGKRKAGPAPGRPLAKRGADLLARTPLGGWLVWDKARQRVRAQGGDHYPAPLVAIDVVREGLKLPLARALDLEAGAFSQLVVSDTAKNLMAIFFAKNEVEARAGRTARAARPVATVGVLGAGFMGSGIAQVLASKGTPVVLKDKDEAALGRGLAHCQERFAELAARRRLREPEVKLAMARILPTTGYAEFRRLGFVVEAVFEDLAVKHAVLREVEAAAPEGLIFASNTSTLPIARIAEASRRPENVVGMHFFSPVHKMPLLEVIRHPGTSGEALATTLAVGRAMGKTPIVVDDGPGFFTSRVLGPFLNEAAWLLVEGAAIDDVDRALRQWGWPVGPFELLDEVGLDIAAHAGEIVRSYLGDRLEPPAVFARMLADGRLGRKAKRGFYLYGDGPKRVDPAVDDLLGRRPAAPGTIEEREVVERCWLQMLNETARCIEDGVIANPADVDLGVILGFGFPPFRGGLLREADRLGLDQVVERLDLYASRHGARLAPAALLREMANCGATFYPAGR